MKISSARLVLPKTSGHVPEVLSPFSIPEFAQARIERVVVRLEVAREFGGDGRVESAIGCSGTVAGVTEDADFVFDLHHEHGVICASTCWMCCMSAVNARASAC